MTDDGKRTEVLSVKVTERMALDLLRLATARDRSVSNLMYCALRRWMYGDIVSLEASEGQVRKVDD